MSPEFLITALIVVASPGTGVLYTLAYGLGGLAALLHASALAFEAIKYAGVAYLLWMAWQTLKETGALAVGGAEDRRGLSAIVLRGIAINLLNPKLSIFFLAFLPQFVDAAAPHPVPRMLELSAVFMAMTLAVFVVYGFAAAAVRDHVVSRPTVMAWLRRSFAAAFVALGARLALAER